MCKFVGIEREFLILSILSKVSILTKIDSNIYEIKVNLT